MDWLTDLKNWLIGIIKEVWTAISGFYHDISVKLLSSALEAIGKLVNSIEVPSWMHDYSLSHLFGLLDPALGYFVDRVGIATGVSLLGLGYVFRIGRKLATALQW